eukprot:3840439-Prymnesium_polylepis.1
MCIRDSVRIERQQIHLLDDDPFVEQPEELELAPRYGERATREVDAGDVVVAQLEAAQRHADHHRPIPGAASREKDAHATRDP